VCLKKIILLRHAGPQSIRHTIPTRLTYGRAKTFLHDYVRSQTLQNEPLTSGLTYQSWVISRAGSQDHGSKRDFGRKIIAHYLLRPSDDGLETTNPASWRNSRKFEADSAAPGNTRSSGDTICPSRQASGVRGFSVVYIRKPGAYNRP